MIYHHPTPSLLPSIRFHMLFGNLSSFLMRNLWKFLCGWNWFKKFSLCFRNDGFPFSYFNQMKNLPNFRKFVNSKTNYHCKDIKANTGWFLLKVIGLHHEDSPQSTKADLGFNKSLMQMVFFKAHLKSNVSATMLVGHSSVEKSHGECKSKV